MENNTKVFCLKAKDEFELVKLMNENQKKNNVFASQPMQKKDKSWVCFIYYKLTVLSNQYLCISFKNSFSLMGNPDFAPMIESIPHLGHKAV